METLYEQSRRTVETCAKYGVTIATAESCTGGMIATMLTDVAGSSSVFCGAYVTYTNSVKERLLGVSPQTIAQESEVSFACAEEMARGVRTAVGTTIGISTTGYAGPSGGNARDPIGTVYIGWSTEYETASERFTAPEGADRRAVREAATARALEILRMLAASRKEPRMV